MTQETILNELENYQVLMASANDSQTDKKDVYLHQALQINVAIGGIIKMENSLGRVLFKSDVR